MATRETVKLDETKLEQFATKVALEQNAGVTAVLAYVADQVGLWATLSNSGPVTSSDLAERTGLDHRYLAEWLAAFAAAGYVEYDPSVEQFRLPPEHALVLADDDSPFALAGGFEFQAGCWADADKLADLLVSGEGLAWGDRDERLARGVARFYQPLYEASLLDEWLPAVEGLVEVLTQDSRVLDVGCGYGFATRLIARSFPNATVLGVDQDRNSVEIARKRAAEEGVQNVEFRTAAGGDDLGKAWDVAFLFDVFHHLARPVDVAKQLRAALTSDGTLVLVEPLARDTIRENLAAAGPLYYAPSALVCVPDAMAQHGGVALGAQAGPARTLALLEDAGFTIARVAAETDYNMVYEARP